MVKITNCNICNMFIDMLEEITLGRIKCYDLIGYKYVARVNIVSLIKIFAN